METGVASELIVLEEALNGWRGQCSIGVSDLQFHHEGHPLHCEQPGDQRRALRLFWMLTLMPHLKYVCIVLRTDDNGEGGTFAFYSLLRHHACAVLLPPGHRAAGDEGQLFDAAGVGIKKATAENGNAVTLGDHCRGAAAGVKRLLEKHKVLQRVLHVLALVGKNINGISRARRSVRARATTSKKTINQLHLIDP